MHSGDKVSFEINLYVKMNAKLQKLQQNIQLFRCNYLSLDLNCHQ